MKVLAGVPAFSTLIAALAVMTSVSPVQAQSTLQTVQERGVLLAGVRFDLPPTGYLDLQGNHIGFGPDIAREFAKRLGVEVEFVQTTSKSRIPLLLNGQIDAEIGPTTPTKTRDEVIDFSYTYITDQGVILVREGDSVDPRDYFNSEVRVGGMQGSFFVDLWKESSPEANFIEYQEFPELVVALTQDKVDVVPIPAAQAYTVLEQYGDRASNLAVGGVFFEDSQAIGVRENDSAWRDWINWALQRMWADGTFQALYRKHFKIDPPFQMGDAGRLQPGVEKIAGENDPWHGGTSE